MLPKKIATENTISYKIVILAYHVLQASETIPQMNLRILRTIKLQTHLSELFGSNQFTIN